MTSRTPGLARLPAFLGLVVAVLALCACSRARLDLDPAVINGCALGHMQAIRVSWDARAVHEANVLVSIRRPGSRMRGWVRGHATGSRMTGRWVSDGMTFVLSNPAGKQLAIRTVETTRCPMRQKDE